MASSGEIFDIKQKHLIGKLVFSPVSKGRIIGIDMPEESSVVTVTAEDLHTNNCLICDEFVPILAHDSIKYLNQPVMAVFGPDSETVDMFCSKVEIKVDTKSSSHKKIIEDSLPPFLWFSGDVSKHFTPEAKIVESSFTVAGESAALNSNVKILANFIENNCYIQAPSQWPMHVKSTVASALGTVPSNVKIYTNSFRADFDQLLISPSLYAAVTAVAAKKAGCLTELLFSAVSRQPETVFKRATVINAEGKPVAEKISVTADFGAFPVFKEEAYYNILAGLIPSYALSAVSVSIEIKKSTNEPAAFFGDLGYGMAVAFTEQHFSKIAKEIKKSPYEWRVENLAKVSLISEKVRKNLSFDLLKETLEECAQASWFDRKNSVYSQDKFINQKVSPVAGYAKGIGIACANGIAGFSEKYPLAAQNQLSISMTEDGRVYVNLGFYLGNDSKEAYKQFIQERLDVSKENIFFTDFNSDQVKDFGPNVLSRSVSVLPKMLDDACNGILRRMRTGKKPPIVQQIFYASDMERPLFDANTFGSIAISVHIDPVKVVPVIDNVTARLRFGKVYSTTVLSRRIRQTICSTISQICPCIENNFSIDLKVKSNPNLPSGSCTSMLRGITAAALTSAISQALSHELHSIPVNDKDVISIVQMKKEPEEAQSEA